MHALYITADYTFRVDVYNFSLGVVFVVTRRKLAGTWRSIPWPLAAVFSATETGGGYLNAFRALAEALKRHWLPEPGQVSSDYFLE